MRCVAGREGLVLASQPLSTTAEDPLMEGDWLSPRVGSEEDLQIRRSQGVRYLQRLCISSC